MAGLAFLIMLLAAPADEAAVRIARTAQNAAIAMFCAVRAARIAVQSAGAAAISVPNTNTVHQYMEASPQA